MPKISSNIFSAAVLADAISGTLVILLNTILPKLDSRRQKSSPFSPLGLARTYLVNESKLQLCAMSRATLEDMAQSDLPKSMRIDGHKRAVGPGNVCIPCKVPVLLSTDLAMGLSFNVTTFEAIFDRVTGSNHSWWALGSIRP